MPAAKKIKEKSPSNPKIMPTDFIPLHFFSWLKHGPASDSQHPLWQPDTGKAQTKPAGDILDLSDKVSGNGKMSSFSRKAQRMELTHKRDGESKILDLTASEEINSGFLRESVRNSSMMVSLLQGVSDPERKNCDALVQNAAKIYDLDPTSENKAEYLNALTTQKLLLKRRSQPPLSTPTVKELPCYDRDVMDFEHLGDDDCNISGHNLDTSLTIESCHSSSPVLNGDSPQSNSLSIFTSSSSSSSGLSKRSRKQ